MEMHESSQQIDETAVQWAVRVETTSLTPDERAQLDNWLKGDRRRLGAYAKARAVIAQVRRAKDVPPKTDAIPRKASRRRFLIGGAVAASCAAAAITTTAVLKTGTQSYATRLGEIRLIPLADGSSVTLNTDSRISVLISATERVVRLLQGEALFSITDDVMRPFVIDAGEALILTGNSQLMVSRLVAEPLKVLVRDGQAAVKRRQHEEAPLRLTANTRAEITEASQIQVMTPAEMNRELVWREGMLSFEDMPLEQALARFARYNSLRIVLDDPSLKQETVTGLFSATDPEGFATAVAATLDLKLYKQAGVLHIRR